MEIFGVSTDGDIGKLHEQMMDCIRGLQKDEVAARARLLDLDDPGLFRRDLRASFYGRDVH